MEKASPLTRSWHGATLPIQRSVLPAVERSCSAARRSSQLVTRAATFQGVPRWRSSSSMMLSIRLTVAPWVRRSTSSTCSTQCFPRDRTCHLWWNVRTLGRIAARRNAATMSSATSNSHLAMATRATRTPSTLRGADWTHHPAIGTAPCWEALARLAKSRQRSRASKFRGHRSSASPSCSGMPPQPSPTGTARAPWRTIGRPRAWAFMNATSMPCTRARAFRSATVQMATP
mmetsp:Transcript_71639/g.158421  ORF Transcript_71639/g.158421 Transcript_71639/m.158421 type:complete len:231 (+) Transcript_71639:808-1500(+)